jgi:nucleoside-diphosphate-sugar epimerase
MNEDTKRVVLTGGAGFISSHLVEELLRRGAQLTIVDNLDDFYSRTWKRANLEDIGRAGNFDFLGQDICDIKTMREAIAATRPDALIHLAAHAEWAITGRMKGSWKSPAQERWWERLLDSVGRCRSHFGRKVASF